MAKCIGYIRVSTDLQINNYSLDVQEARILEYASTISLPCTIYRDEGISGREYTSRDGLRSALEALSLGDVFCVYSLSRLSRNVEDTIQLLHTIENKGATIYSLTEKLDASTASGKLFLQLTSVISEFEVNVISERVSLGMQQKIHKKEHIGRPPYGYKLKDTKGSGLIQDPYEQQVIAVAREARLKKLSYQAIATLLTQKGYTTRNGSLSWYKPLVKSMILSTPHNISGRTYKTIANEEESI